MSAEAGAIEELREAPTRDQILRLQAAMVPIQVSMPEAGHYFAPGMYGRTLLVPAGMTIVGKTHRHAHLLMVLKGHATVASEFGVEELRAPYIGVSQPGVKRVVHAHEDTLFVTVHHNPSDTEDLDEIEAHHINGERDLIEAGGFDFPKVA